MVPSSLTPASSVFLASSRASAWRTTRSVSITFDERDIEIPFPHQTIYFGVDKKGEAPALRLKGKED